MAHSWEYIGFFIFQVEHFFSFQMFSLCDSYLYPHEKLVLSVDCIPGIELYFALIRVMCSWTQQNRTLYLLMSLQLN